MKNTLNFLIIILCAVVFTACSKNKEKNFESSTKFDTKPQVKDILQGKSKAEVLKMKYKTLSASCAIETQKITRGQDAYQTAGNSPAPTEPENPISNPKENTVIYDLKLQQLGDRELTKEVTANLTAAKDNQVLNLEITFKPVVFQETLNIDLNKKKYVLKHTPVIVYQGNYQLLHADSSIIVGKIQGKIYEKIQPQDNELIAIEIGNDKYIFMLSCNLERLINPENATFAAEFNSQWTEIDCLTPKNEAEKMVCK